MESSSYPNGSFNPLVLIHETGHALGLPDYYDYDDYENDGVIKGPNGGVGGLDMMDSNLGDHNAFSKFVLDWLPPTVISATGTYPGQILSSSANAADALLIMPNASTSPFGEFFMAQHRKREKNDAEISTDGLLIWHVDARLNAAGTDYLYDNSSTAHKLLRLMEADGLEEIETGATNPDRQVDAGDFYTAGKSFIETSTPNSNAYSSFATGVQVTNIADTGNDMTCDVAINKVVRSAQIAAGDFHAVFIQSDGSLWTWGNNKPKPVKIGTDTDWQTVAAGWYNNLALKNDGSLWAWGSNNHGQLGDGTTIAKNSPVRIGTDNNWQAITSGAYHVVAIKSDGSLWTWGYNNDGELGDGTRQAVDSKSYHNVAVKTDGSLWTWGDNQYGQLGDGTTNNKHTPIKVGAENNWRIATAVGYHTSAIKDNGTFWAWGLNYDGQLGDGTANDRYVPVQIGTGSDWKTLTSGGWHTIALKSNGILWACGDNELGQLGDGTTSIRYAPVRIIFSSNSDTDSDGIDDGWERTYFGNMTTANATSDYDKDGYSDKQEYLNWHSHETASDGTVYDPTAKNVPGGTGYQIPATGSTLPAIYKLLLKH